jgi:hypothetical protein
MVAVSVRALVVGKTIMSSCASRRWAARKQRSRIAALVVMANAAVALQFLASQARTWSKSIHREAQLSRKGGTSRSGLLNDPDSNY